MNECWTGNRSLHVWLMELGSDQCPLIFEEGIRFLAACTAQRHRRS